MAASDVRRDDHLVELMLAAEQSLNVAICGVVGVKTQQLEALQRGDRLWYSELLPCLSEAVQEGKRLNEALRPLRERWDAAEPPAAARQMLMGLHNDRGTFFMLIARLDAAIVPFLAPVPRAERRKEGRVG